MEENKEIEKFHGEAERALSLHVVDAPTYQEMAALVLTARKAIKYFEELYRPRITQANEVVKALRSDMQKLQEPAVKAKEHGDKELAVYQQAEEQKARAEQLRLQREAKEREEKEKLELASLAEQAGEKQLAEDILNAPSVEPVAVVAPATPKVEGLSYSTSWDFEIENESLIPREFLIVDAVKIRRVITALKETANIPGVRAFSKKIVRGANA